MLFVVALVLLVAGLALAAPTEPRGEPDRATEGVVTTTTPSGLRIHALRTGWVRVKETHRELRGPDAFRIPAVLGGRAWADWMPIWSYVVEHPERTVLVDTGASPELERPGYAACDPNNQWFYERNLRFRAPEDELLAARLAQVGLRADDVDDLLITHFHGDHVGGLPSVAHARTWVGPGNWPSHVGAVPCMLPQGFEPTTISWDGATTAGLATQDLTTDGAVKLVSLPGHTPGHAGLLVQDGDRRWMMVGDATFDLDQTHRCAIAGVTEEPERARATQRALDTLVQDDVVLLPSHDPTVPARLRAGPRS